MTRTMPKYQGAVTEAVAAITTRINESGLTGSMAAADIIANGAGFDTLGGTYRLTSFTWRGQRNPTRTYTNLAAALVAHNALSAGFKQIWHVDVAGHRHLIVRN